MNRCSRQDATDQQMQQSKNAKEGTAMKLGSYEAMKI